MKFHHSLVFTVLIVSAWPLGISSAQTKGKQIPSELLGKWHEQHSKTSSAGADVQYSIYTEITYDFHENRAYSIKTSVDSVYYKDDNESDECRHKIYVIENGKYNIIGNIVKFYYVRQIGFTLSEGRSVCDNLNIRIRKNEFISYVKRKYSKEWHFSKSEFRKGTMCIQLRDVTNTSVSPDEYCRD